MLAIHSIVFSTFGVFLKPLIAEFGWERGAISGAFSVYMVLAGTLAIFAGRLSDKYGPRIPLTLGGILYGIGFFLMSQISSLWQVYLIWIFFMGAGGGCFFVPIASSIPRWFAKKAGPATGIAVAGFGVGVMISPLLAQWLIDAYGWRQAFITLAIIASVITIPIAQFMKHSPQRIGLKPYGASDVKEDKNSPAVAVEELSFLQAIKTGRFWILSLILFCFFFSVQVTLVHIVPHATDIGIAKVAAASIISIVGGASIVSRLSTGFISDKIGGRLTLNGYIAIATLGLIWLIFAQEIWMFYVFAALFGLAHGGTAMLQNIVTAELFGLRSLGMILAGATVIAWSGGAGGPILAGSIFDATGSYTSAFLTCAILGVIGIILCLVLLRYKPKGDTVVSE